MSDNEESVTNNSIPSYQESNPNNNTETYVRLRINWSEDAYRGVSVGLATKQTTNPIFYQGNFKELADGLFIDAIQLTPAEMQ